MWETEPWMALPRSQRGWGSVATTSTAVPAASTNLQFLVAHFRPRPRSPPSRVWNRPWALRHEGTASAHVPASRVRPTHERDSLERR